MRPAKGQFYYVLRGFGEMRPFPPGLRMVAGDAHARRPQSRRVTYPITDGHDVVLASGGQLTGHADFFNAWRQPILDSLVQRCLNANVDCHAN